MDFLYITKREELSGLFSDLLVSNEIVVDVESSSLDEFSAVLLLVQLEVNNNIYILDVRKLGKELIKYIISIVVESKKVCIGHNIKFDAKMIYTNTGEKLENLFDTMIAEVLINQGVGKQFYSLQEIVFKYCGINLDKSSRSTFIDYTGEITNEQIIYSALDVKYLREIKKLQTDILINQGQENVLILENKVEVPIYSMELNGVSLDSSQWTKLSETADIKAKEIEKDLKDRIIKRIEINKYSSAFELADAIKIPVKTKKLKAELENIKDPSIVSGFVYNNINVNSHSQMLCIINLLSGLGLKSTDEKILKDYINKEELIQILLDYREQQKRRSTYGDNLIQEINPVTNRLHVDFNQVGASTGRFSVARLQQIPRDKEYRKGFVAKKGFKIITADYSQEEYRLTGAISGEPRIIEAYIQKKDMHISTASLVLEKSMDQISKIERDYGKTINFAIIYGSTEYGLARNLGIDIDRGREILNIFWRGYPRLYEFKLQAEEFIWEHKFSVTPYGRKRYFKDQTLFVDDNEYFKYQRRVKREGFNHIIQGCGADVIKLAMVDIYFNNPFIGSIFFYNQAHDEIVLEVEESKVTGAVEFVRDCMLKAEQPFLKEIPAKVDIQVNDYWSKE